MMAVSKFIRQYVPEGKKTNDLIIIIIIDIKIYFHFKSFESCCTDSESHHLPMTLKVMKKMA